MTENKDEAKEGVVDFAKVEETRGNYTVWLGRVDYAQFLNRRDEAEAYAKKINTAITAFIGENYKELVPGLREEVTRLKKEYETSMNNRFARIEELKKENDDKWAENVYLKDAVESLKAENERLKWEARSIKCRKS